MFLQVGCREFMIHLSGKKVVRINVEQGTHKTGGLLVNGESLILTALFILIKTMFKVFVFLKKK